MCDNRSPFSATIRGCPFSPVQLLAAMSILQWVRSVTKTLAPFSKRNQRRRLSIQPSLSALDALEPRLLLSATVIEEIPDANLATAEDSTMIDLSQHFDDTELSGSLVKVETSLGSFYIETYDQITPVTAANFLDLVSGGNYDDMFFHRSDPGFVLQGGGFAFPDDTDAIASVVNNGTIVNEFDNWFDPELGGYAAGDPVNLRGTIAMAKQAGNPDSATSQYFISVADNQAILDGQNGGFTVFAHVVYDGMTVVDELMELEIINVGSAFTELPVVDLAANATAVARENLLFGATTLAEELQFSITSSDLVTAEIVDGQLTVSPTAAGALQGGSVSITVTATDVAGTEVTSTFEVTLPEFAVTGPTDVTTSTPTITWNGTSSADSYDLRISRLDDRLPDVIQTADVVVQNSIAATSYTVTEDLPDGQYVVTINPRTGNSVGAPTEGFVFYVGLGQPATATSVTVTPSAENELAVTFSWDAADDATHYDIWVSEVGGDVVMREDWIGETSYVLPTQLEAGKTYRAWIRGRNVLETGGWSAVLTFVGGTAVPGMAEITSPAGAVSATTEAITWTADPVASGYDVWIGADGAGDPVQRVTTTDPTFTPDALAEGFYRVWVRAVNGNGFGSWSRPVSFGIADSGQKSAVSGPTGDPIAVQPAITWTTSVPGGTYHLWVNQVGGQAGIINERDLTTESFTPDSELADGPYTAWIRQISDTGVPLAWSSAFQFEVGASTQPDQPVLAVETVGDVTTFSWDAVTNGARYELWVNLGSVRVLHETELTSLTYSTSELQSGTHRVWLRAYSSTGVVGQWSTAVGFSI